MKTNSSLLSSIALRFVLTFALLSGFIPLASPAPEQGRPDILLETMQQELTRASKELAKSDPPVYFISYSAVDQEEAGIVASYGALTTSFSASRRIADVTVRVGSIAMDNTHGESRGSGLSSGTLPLGEDRDAIARTLWELTNREYRRAAPAFLKVKNDAAVRTEEEDKSPDFSQETPQVRLDGRPGSFEINRPLWEQRVRDYSALFRKFPEVYSSIVVLQMEKSRSRFVSSEGSRLESPSTMVRLLIEAETRAADGMELLRVETFQAPALDQLPGEAEIRAKIETMAADLKALRAAPLAEPFNGPALLSGRAAAVFFHEVLGHRVEGHRQRDEDEGQTFTKKVNEQVLPEFLSVVDDPTQRVLNGQRLSGAYDFDDEGVPAGRVEVIKNGVLKNFLMSRMPIKNFSKSNGHGRAQPGEMPTGRQGNLIVTSTRTIKDAEMRQKLIEEVKKQGKPYGLYFEDVQGGFTLTSRSFPQAFQVLPVIVWRIYADGRPDELVRGVDIVGTPLAALNRILLTGDTQKVFNGICGAESGSIPVSASAPAMLFSELEVQRQGHSRTRPPILPPPGFESGANNGNEKAPSGEKKP
jgi:TldD protein